MSRLPFALRRPLLLWQGATAKRQNPPLQRLERLEDPEGFLWAVLPYAARSFAACMAMLPEPRARASAVAYLYCRILDNAEDLVPGLDRKSETLGRLAARFTEEGDLRDAERAEEWSNVAPRDGQDAANLLLSRKVERIDRVYRTLSPPVRSRIAVLVHRMAAAMQRSARWFHDQGGVLHGDDQLEEYCYGVIGHPLEFSVWLHGEASGQRVAMAPSVVRGAAQFLQLANVTRDLEADLAHGVAYHPDLRGALRNSDSRETIRKVRVRLVGRALAQAPAYLALVDSLSFPKRSLDRGAALLMLLFTARFYARCLTRAEVPVRMSHRSTARILTLAARAAWSRKFAATQFQRELADLREMSKIAGEALR